jgi:hypothetical protein
VYKEGFARPVTSNSEVILDQQSGTTDDDRTLIVRMRETRSKAAGVCCKASNHSQGEEGTRRRNKATTPEGPIEINGVHSSTTRKQNSQLPIHVSKKVIAREKEM